MAAGRRSAYPGCRGHDERQGQEVEATTIQDRAAVVRLVQQPSVDGCGSRVYCGIVRFLLRSQDEAEGLSHSVQVFEQLAELGLQGALQEVGEGESNVNSRENARELDTGDWLQGGLAPVCGPAGPGLLDTSQSRQQNVGPLFMECHKVAQGDRNNNKTKEQPRHSFYMSCENQDQTAITKRIRAICF
ncbi:uncharacterized [Tachysurus ichikawai]